MKQYYFSKPKISTFGILSTWLFAAMFVLITAPVVAQENSKPTFIPPQNEVGSHAPDVSGIVAASAERNGEDCILPHDPADGWTQASFTIGSGGGNLQDDGSTVEIPLPFSFDFFGDMYSSFWINVNGNISLSAPYWHYTSTGFPSDQYVMLAPFWADVDLNGAGEVWYKVTDHAVYVNWVGVGYYNAQSDMVNTFQLIFTDGTDPLIGLGNNVAFYFGDMQWTTGSASGGSNGFGGTPATVGLNAGNGEDFIQIGRFDQPGTAYDGPGGANDGVDWLDGQCFEFDASGTNIPPIAEGFPQNPEVCVGVTETYTVSFLAPELNQITSTEVTTNATGLNIISNTDGNPSTIVFEFTGSMDNLGPNIITFVATDDHPMNPESTTVNLTINVVTSGSNCPVDINCPEDIEIACGETTDPNFTGIATIENDPGNVFTVDYTDEVSGSCPTVITRTWSIVPPAGVAPVDVSCVQTITIADNEAPVISGEEEITVECDSTDEPAFSVEDNCDENPEVSAEDVIEPGDCSGYYTIIRTITAEDNCGNTSTFTQTINVVDTTAPEFDEEIEDFTVECEDDVPAFEEISATDNCSAEVQSWSFEFPLNGGDTTCVLTDAVGPGVDWSIVLFNFPGATDYYVFNTPGSMQMYNDGSAIITGTVEAINNPAQQWEVFIRLENKRDWNDWSALGRDYKDDLSLAGTSYIDWSYYEMDNNNSFLIGAGDFDGSFLQLSHMPASYLFGFQCGLAANNKNANFGMSGWFHYEGFFNGTAVGGHGDINVDKECEGGGQETECLFEIERFYIAVDDCGNTNVANQTITVEDTTGPEFTVTPDDLIFDCYGDIPAPDASELEAVDNCGGPVVITFADDILIGSECDGVISRSYDAVDECGNLTKYIQTITIADTLAPVLNGVPADLELSCEEEVPAPANVTASDNCDTMVNVIFSEMSEVGNCPQNEVITRTWSATDSCGNEVSATQIITITDETAPVITECPEDAHYTCIDDVPAAEIELVSATDNCGMVTITHVGDNMDGDECEGTITRTYIATDECGNSATCVQVITYNDDVAPEFINTPDSQISVDCASVPEPEELQAEDNCSEVNIEFEETYFSGGCPGVIQRMWTATDQCGNQTVFEQFITLVDTVAPTLHNLPEDATYECDEEIPAPAEVTGTDNCDANVIVNFEETTEPGSCPEAYMIYRTWTATDTCENTVSYTQVINIVDTTAPEFDNIPADFAVQCADDIPEPEDLTATDNCDENVTINFDEAMSAQSISSITAAIGDDYALSLNTFIPGSQDYTFEENASFTQYSDGTAHLHGFVTSTTYDQKGWEVSIWLTQRTDWEEWSENGGIYVDDNNLVNEEFIDWNFYIINAETSQLTGTGDYEGFSLNVSQAAVPANSGFQVGDVANNRNTEWGMYTRFYFNGFFDGGNVNGAGNIYLDGQEGPLLSDECSYEVIRTWTATDNCGNSTTIQQVILVEDTIAPEFTVTPDDLFLACYNDVPAPDVTLFEAEDNCGGPVEIVHAGDILIGDECEGVISRIYDAIDECGNLSKYTQLITFADTVAPVLSGVPMDTEASCDDIPEVANVTANDNCDGEVNVIFSEMTEEGECPQSYTIIRTWTSTDDCGNTASASQSIFVFDDVAPVITECPEDAHYDCINDVPAPNTDLVSATDNCGIVSITHVGDEMVGDECEGTITRTYRATDECGNSTDCVQVISYSDDVAPQFINTPPTSITADCDNIPDPSEIEVIDNCSEVTIDFEQYETSGGCPGGIYRIWTATDECGNSSTFEQYINLIDTVPPTLHNLPADATYECDEDVPGPAEVWGTDNCDEAVDVMFEETTEMGDCPQEYTIYRTWSATDTCENSVSYTQVINIVDTTAPVFDAEDSEMTVACDEVVEVATPMATDNCDTAVQVEMDMVSLDGECVNEWTEIYTWTATDACGNSSIVSLTINYVDDQAPEFTEVPEDLFFDCIEDVPAADTGLLAAIDNCGDVVITHEGDMQNGDDCEAVISRTYRATDECGNYTEYVQSITVADTLAPVLAGVPMDTEASCDDIPEVANVTASDNCDDAVNVIFSEMTEEGDCPQSYTIIRTWTSSDSCGNTATASQSIFVFDNVAPVITECPEDAHYDCIDDVPAPNTELVSATDNCGLVSIVHVGDVQDGDECEGTITRTYRATDECGNSADCVQVITYNDDVAPVFVNAPENTEAACDNVPDPADVIAEDNCSEVTIEFEETLFSGGCPGVLQRIWTATDQCGNYSVHEQFITLIDTVAPTLHNVPADETVLCSDEDIIDLISTGASIEGMVSGNNLVFYPGDGTGSEEHYPVGVYDDSAPGFPSGSFAANGEIYTIIAFTPQQLFGYDIKISDIASMSFYTKQAVPWNPLPSQYLNWYLSMLTTQDGVEDDGTFFGHQLSFETFFSVNVDAPANEWVKWSTDEGPNQLRVFDPYRGATQMIFGTYSDPHWSDILAGPIDWGSVDVNYGDGEYDYRDEDVLLINFGTGSAWADGFEGQLDGFEIVLINGDVATINFEPSPEGEEEGVTATDNCDESVDVIMSEVIIPGECAQQFTIERTWTATDSCDNTTSATQIITVEAVPPVISGEDMSFTVDCDEDIQLPEFTVSDECQPDVELVLTVDTLSGDCPNEWTEIYTWTATNDCGLSDHRVVTYIYQDNEAPIFTMVPDSIEVECGMEIPVTEAAATDNCGDVYITYLDSQLMEDECAGYIIRTFTATDECGNSSTAEQIIDIIDTTAPVITECPADEHYDCIDDVPAPNTELVSATDDCSMVSITHVGDDMNGDECEGTITRTYRATDECGNSTDCVQVITYNDNVAPEFINAPENITVDCADVPDPMDVEAVDNCSNVSIEYSEVYFSGGCPGVIERTWVATDECGNYATHIQYINLIDTVAPTLHNLPADATYECDEEVPAPAEVWATDNCDEAVDVMFEESTEAGDCPQEYTIYRTWTATDTCENSVSHTQVINIVDTTAPVFDAEDSEITVACDEVVEIATPMATDNCDSAVMVDMDMVSTDGECANEWTEVYTWTATDACGNSSSVSLTVNYVDEVAPEFTEVPGDLFFECIEDVPAADTGLLAAIDNCGDVIITHEGDMQNGGDCEAVISRTYRATDECGNYTEYVQSITVADTLAPVLAGVPMDTEASCDDIPEVANVTASDNCDDAVNVIFSEMTEPGDCPQSYTIIRTWTATDSCGNTASATQNLWVYDNVAPVITECPEDEHYDCIDDVPAPNTELVSAIDNCGIVSITHVGDQVDGDECEGTITRTYRATDECGNSTDCVQVITYNDNVAPVFVNAPGNTEADCDNIPNPADVVATDNCSEVTIEFSETLFSGGCAGVLQRIWVATDACGNSTTHEQFISLIDTVAPVLSSLPADATYECDEDVPGAPEVWATDNCDEDIEVEFTENVEMGDCPQSYTIIRTWTATDECDNTVSHTQTITIQDTTAPVFNIEDNEITISCDTEIAIDTPVATDNCDSAVNVDLDITEIEGECANEWTVVYTWTATDACGNSSSVSLTVNYIDEVAPEFTEVPGDLFFECIEDVPAANVQLLSAIDNCGDVIITHQGDMQEGDDCEAAISRTYRATDECGNYTEYVQTITVADTLAPWFNESVEDMTVECDMVPEPDSITASDNCDVNVNVAFDEQMEDGECEGSYTLIRTWTATDNCGNSEVLVQVITVEDNTAPVFVDAPEDATYHCDDEIPELEAPMAVDNCSSTITYTAEEFIEGYTGEDGLAQCHLTTPLDVVGAAWALWLPNSIGEPQYYYLTPAGGQFVELPNGRAHLTGTVYAPSNPDKRWVIDVYFKDRADWDEWNGVLGRSYKDDANFATPEALYENWDYYILNADSATLSGDGLYGGSELTLTHAPASNFFGFQVGEAANNRNAADGMSGWFFYNGQWLGNEGVNGIGDFAFEKECPECDYTITRIWTATDDCGNTATAMQVITVIEGDDENENLDEVNPVKAPSVLAAWPNPAAQRSTITFEIPVDSRVVLEVFNMDGKLIKTLYQGEANAHQEYFFNFEVGDLSNGLYLYKLTTDKAAYIEKLMITK